MQSTEDKDLDFQYDSTEAAHGNVEHRRENISARVTILDPKYKDDLGTMELRHLVRAGDQSLVGSLAKSGANVNR